MSDMPEPSSRPWERPIWKPVRGKEGVLAYLVAIHALAILGIALFPIPSLPVLAAALVVACLGGLGTTVCYHRCLSHRTVKLNGAVEHALIFFTMFNGSGSPASWAAYHRRHHARADTPDDISSPTHGGFWWAHLRWLYQTPPADVGRWCPDLDGPRYRFWTRAQTPVVALAIFAGGVFGWEAFFWLGAVRLVYSLHMQCFVNSAMHMGAPSETGETAKNLWWLGPLQITAWGENWHANHHAFANSARLGLRWWQVDVGWYFICALEALGLARNVKRPGYSRSRSRAAA